MESRHKTHFGLLWGCSGRLGDPQGLFRAPREAFWIALGHLGTPPEATRDIGTKATITIQGVWGPLTDTVNSICNQFTGISYRLLGL